jgi:chromosome segregation protein
MIIVQELEELRARLLTLKDREARLKQEFLNIQAKETEAEALLRRQQLKIEQTETKIEWKRSEQERLQGEIHILQEQRKSFETELTELEDSVNIGEEEVATLLNESAELSNIELHRDIAHWNTRIAVIEQVLGELRTRQNERQHNLDDFKARIGERHSELVDVTRTQNAIISEIEMFREKSKQINLEIEDLQNKIGPSDKSLEEYEDRMADLQSRESGARQELSKGEHLLAQARVSVVKQQEGLEGLRTRIEDDFGLVAFEYIDEISGPNPLPIEGLVEELPVIERIAPEFEEVIKHQRSMLRRMGPINPEARNEYLEVQDRFQFLVNQMKDLHKAAEDVRQVIAELDDMMARQFKSTFSEVAEEFHQIFSRLFGGGSARLIMTDPDDLTQTGIEIEARLPGRREQGLSLLSGGERSLSAVALVFALLRVSPTPFCVLDEVDAMLDEANVGRFGELLKELSQTTQFLLITHNRATVQVADVIYGVTMGRDSTTQTISLKIDEVEKVVQSVA